MYDVAVESALDNAPGLTERTGNKVLLKREDEQPVYSFKVRGAYNRMAQLTDDEKARGVITASAGNHAQGVANAAKYLGVKATIVMPKTTPDVKVINVRRLGGKVILHGDAFDDARQHAAKLEEERGLTYIPPYDDPEVIAGQGTVAMEILRQHTGPIDAIFIPVGGGGLIAGMAAYVKYLRPETKIIGVEFEESACLALAMKKGRRATLSQVGIFADGVAVAQIGKHTWEICKDHVDEVITVNVDQICAAVKDIFDDTRAASEPAGALAVAGLKLYVEREQCQNKTLIAINSGANVNFDRLRHIAERSEIGEKREMLIAAKIPERAGAFKQFCKTLGNRNITEFNYRYSNPDDAIVFAGIQIRKNNDGREELLAELGNALDEVTDLTDNEVAKMHIRHMVGGHKPDSCKEEALYRFEFPERPGALMKFLNTLGGRWNISMFHYRNHGAAYGRVLVGMDVPRKERADIRKYFDELGYTWFDETDNEAYRLFLG